MKQVSVIDGIVRDLSIGEMISINGGGPSKKTSFFYDVCYYIGHAIGEAVQDGILTYDWWANWSIDISS
jgi:hypothetical protein